MRKQNRQSQVSVKWVPKGMVFEQCPDANPVDMLPVVPLSALREVVEAAVEAEEELPGEIPQEIYDTIINGNKEIVAKALRIVVRATKKGIKQRLLTSLGEVGK